jgi:hypothetical protein
LPLGKGCDKTRDGIIKGDTHHWKANKISKDIKGLLPGIQLFAGCVRRTQLRIPGTLCEISPAHATAFIVEQGTGNKTKEVAYDRVQV